MGGEQQQAFLAVVIIFTADSVHGRVDDVENNRGQTLEMEGRGWKVFAGKRWINRGTVKITDSVNITFNAGTYVENGAYISDPSTTHYTQLIVGSGGYLQGGLGDLFIVSGSFVNNSTQNTLWSTASSELDFGNGSSHPFALAGADSGQSISGYTNNFAFGTMDLYSGQTLSLGAGSGTALYVGALVLGSGTSQVTSITGNGHNIYYDVLNPMNNYLGSGTYPLTGGGAILPVSSLPPTMSGTVGQNITFNATVIGSVTFSYQWYKNRVAIGGANQSQLQHLHRGRQWAIRALTTVLVSDTAGSQKHHERHQRAPQSAPGFPAMQGGGRSALSPSCSSLEASLSCALARRNLEKPSSSRRAISGTLPMKYGFAGALNRLFWGNKEYCPFFW